MCKDTSYTPSTNQLKATSKRPFSYAKAQLLWWTLVILSCYAAIFAHTGYLVALTPSMIILLGMGLGVTVIGEQMTNSQREKNMEEAGGVPNLHQDIKDSKGFFIDIMSDEKGVSVHRFQSLAFNLIYGIGFILAFVENTQNLSFPFFEFETWQLIILGVSVAGYLGMKSGENAKDTSTARNIELVKDGAAKTAQQSQGQNANTASNTSVAFANLDKSLQAKGLL